MLLLISSTHCGTYWHRATQAVTMHMYTGLHTQNWYEQRIEIQTDSGYSVYSKLKHDHKDIHSSKVDTCKLRHFRTISVQNNKEKSDLSISIMHMGNSYLGLQQQIASCNAISIKALAPSVDTVFPLTQQTEQCQVQKTKTEERLSGATHTPRCSWLLRYSSSLSLIAHIYRLKKLTSLLLQACTEQHTDDKEGYVLKEFYCNYNICHLKIFTSFLTNLQQLLGPHDLTFFNGIWGKCVTAVREMHLWTHHESLFQCKGRKKVSPDDILYSSLNALIYSWQIGCVDIEFSVHNHCNSKM